MSNGSPGMTATFPQPDAGPGDTGGPDTMIANPGDLDQVGSTIEVSGVCVNFTGSKGSKRKRKTAPAVDNVSFTVEPGEFVAIVGPSGCGKSTLLKVIAGLLEPSKGSVKLTGGTHNDPRVGFVFQSDGLLPWRTALQNVEIATRLAGLDKETAASEARRLMVDLGLEAAGNRFPSQLSGGMRKRVALARAIAYRPAVFLMDEPFSALDAQTRIKVGNFCLEIFGRLKQSVVFVTHDIDEAVALADRVLVLSKGPGQLIADFRIPLARPRDYHATRYVPGFNELQEKVWQALRSGEEDGS